MWYTCTLYVIIPLAMITPSSAWFFSWPYTDDGECQCVKEGVVGRYQMYNNETSCLEAFVSSDVEYCRHEGKGITQEQCSSAVSVTEGITNGHCATKCTELVVENIRLAEFIEECRFEFVMTFEDVTTTESATNAGVAVLPDSCFSNYVWGFADLDPSSTVQAEKAHSFSNVSTVASCQELCQVTPACAFFSWRGVANLESRENELQNAPHFCILYNQDFMDEITDYVLEESSPPMHPDLCDMEQAAVCETLPWRDDKMALFNDYPCQTCGLQARCSWESPVHITGPAFCEKDGRETCSFQRPTWTSTLPPCEPEDERTTALEEGTAETDTALYTGPARDKIDDETTNIVFNQEDPRQNDLEGTAETDFATVTEATTEATTIDLSSESTIELRHV